MKTLTIIRPDDWHVHLRDDQAMRAVIAHTAERFGRALIMPNLQPPVTNTLQALEYRDRISTALPPDSDFLPLMSIYLTDKTSPDEIDLAMSSGVIKAAKLYPAGATTNSQHGVTAVEKIFPVLERMSQADMVLCVHGEVTDADVDFFDREKVFIDRTLSKLTRRFPNLRIVFEHITTQEAVDFVLSSSKNMAATVTAHHLMFNRNAIFRKGLHPHSYCLPVLKREKHRRALIEAVTGGNSRRFFLGTDSAPHSKSNKESSCGCAGCYTAFAGIELYAAIFDEADALPQLEAFASLNGPAFYQLPANSSWITLVKMPWDIPESYPYLPGDPLVPLSATEKLSWRLLSPTAE